VLREYLCSESHNLVYLGACMQFSYIYKYLLHDLCKSSARFVYITLLGIWGCCEIDAQNIVLSNVKEEVKVVSVPAMKTDRGCKGPPC
jgi:hypothetical protein